MRKEAPQIKSGRILGPDIFGNSRPTCQGAINQYPLRLRTGRSDIVNCLHDHPHHQHQHRRKDERGEDMQGLQRMQGIDPQILEQVVCSDGQAKGQCIGVYHLEQVHEPGIPHDPRIRMEDPGTDHAQEGVQEHRIKQLKPVLVRHPRPMKSPIDKGRGNKHYEDISKDDAPIRKDALAKVIMEDSLYPVMLIAVCHNH